jgi:lysophospholipase L1-like esterase
MAARAIDAAALRTVHVSAVPEAQKALYFDENRAAMRPNLVFVDPTGAIIFETNEAGLKGGPLDPNHKLVVVWGDSVVFGAGWGWPCLIDRLAPGWQFLNGGVEGDHYANILRRAAEFNQRHPVSLNLLMLGWHPFVPLPPERRRARRSAARSAERRRLRPGNEDIRSDLTRFLETVPSTAVLTVPTALNPQIIDRDLSSFIVEGDDRSAFRFMGKVRYQMAGQREGFEHIVERNAIAREVCDTAGIRLIDLFAAFDTENLADFREHFIDMIHFRPSAYPLVAQRVYDGIQDLLA